MQQEYYVNTVFRIPLGNMDESWIRFRRSFSCASMNSMPCINRASALQDLMHQALVYVAKLGNLK